MLVLLSPLTSYAKVAGTFTVSPKSVAYGDSVVLRWRVPTASHCNLLSPPETVTDEAIKKLPQSGTLGVVINVRPDFDSGATGRTADYILTCFKKNSSGGGFSEIFTQTKSVTVSAVNTKTKKTTARRTEAADSNSTPRNSELKKKSTQSLGKAYSANFKNSRGSFSIRPPVGWSVNTKPDYNSEVSFASPDTSASFTLLAGGNAPSDDELEFAANLKSLKVGESEGGETVIAFETLEHNLGTWYAVIIEKKPEASVRYHKFILIEGSKSRRNFAFGYGFSNKETMNRWMSTIDRSVNTFVVK